MLAVYGNPIGRVPDGLEVARVWPRADAAAPATARASLGPGARSRRSLPGRQGPMRRRRPTQMSWEEGGGGGRGGGGGGGAVSMPGRQSLSCWVATEGWLRVGCQAGNPLCLGGPTIDVIRYLASALSDGDGRLDCSLFMASCLISNEILSVLIRRRPHRSRRNRWRNKMEKKSISVAAAESIIKQRKVC